MNNQTARVSSIKLNGGRSEEPKGVGEEKYDESAAAMIAQLKYGTCVPFYRQEQLGNKLYKAQNRPLRSSTSRNPAITVTVDSSPPAAHSRSHWWHHPE
jgi:hypothetical protein